MKLFIGLFVVTSSIYAQDEKLARMFDAKLSPAQRNEACFSLRDDRSTATLQGMRAALNVEVVRACAGRNLLQAAAGALLVDTLQDKAPEVRATAARQLGLMKDPEFIPALAAAAAEQNLLVATSAVQGLCQYEDRRVLPALRQVVSRGGIVGAISLSRIAALDGAEALLLARKLLSSADVTDRVLALRIIGDNGNASDLPALQSMADQSVELMARQRGFGLMPPIDLSQAAKRTIAQVQNRVGASERND